MSQPLQFWHHHAGISVPDLEASIAWYRDVLGFELLRRFHMPSIPADVAMLGNGPMHIEVFQLADAAPLPEDRRVPNLDLRTHGTKHFSFAVDDARVFAEELERRGADIVWVKTFPQGINVFIRDNSGNLIEFVEKPRPESTTGTL
ncbi:MAG: VOC family protein [Rudaea sp.]|uniref:VOC family protein n=1 Tax=Rudaea sp. TaxID=2136325 RepID=UPI0039E276BD